MVFWFARLQKSCMLFKASNHRGISDRPLAASQLFRLIGRQCCNNVTTFPHLLLEIWATNLALYSRAQLPLLSCTYYFRRTYLCFIFGVIHNDLVESQVTHMLYWQELFLATSHEHIKDSSLCCLERYNFSSNCSHGIHAACSYRS